MAMHNTNHVLKYGVSAILLILLLLLVLRACHPTESIKQKNVSQLNTINNTAAHDSAAESLDTLTAELAQTRDKINEVAKENALLKKENTHLGDKANQTQDGATQTLNQEVEQLKTQVQSLNQKKIEIEKGTTNFSKGDVITTVADLTQPLSTGQKALANTFGEKTEEGALRKIKPRPYYTIPANGTSVKDRLMTALVGRIPVKGVVTDPYPFKIVLSDDNLAANGLRVPHLQQMIVSGYCEGDLNLVSVRGWVTSLTFVFDDGTISTTTSNDNDMGNFTKANSLGYLSDQFGNPFIRGKLISNAPAYLSGQVALGAATGAATAYAESQTTHRDAFGSTATSVTGSPMQFLGGQAAASAAKEVEAWWHDREEQSFDAIYVAPMTSDGEYVDIAVNFAKEIHIDYDPKGRKLNYAPTYEKHSPLSLD